MADGIEKLLAAGVDRSAGSPVYLQIAAAVKRLVQAGVLAPGAPLPPERVLCAEFGVSRMTLRQAYSVLEREYIIEGHRGRGTFVSPRRMQKQQQEMRSFTEEIRARGGTPHSTLRSFLVTRPSAAAKDFFVLPESELVYRIERVRYSDQVPLAIEAVQIPCYLCPNLERFNLANQSLYGILEREYGLRLARCVEMISALPPTRIHRKLLGLPPKTAVLVIERKTYTKNDTPVEIAAATYRGDLYRALVHSVRPSPAG